MNKMRKIQMMVLLVIGTLSFTGCLGTTSTSKCSAPEIQKSYKDKDNVMVSDEICPDGYQIVNDNSQKPQNEIKINDVAREIILFPIPTFLIQKSAELLNSLQSIAGQLNRMRP